MAPLWEVLKDLVTQEPKTQCVPAIWKFADVKRLMLEAGASDHHRGSRAPRAGAGESRRAGKSRITNSLFAGLQLILPGEIADVHRHTASAIRFVLEGEGAYTAVEGEKTMMKHGDFIITANWAPHDHGNPGKQPVMWLDVLDLPTDQSFRDVVRRAPRREDAEDQSRRRRFARPLRLRRAAGRRAGSTQPLAGDQLPLRQDAADPERLKNDRRHRQASRRARALRQSDQRRAGAADHGRHLALLPKGFEGEPYRSTDGTIFAVRRRQGHHHHRRQAVRMGRQRRVRGAAVEALPAQRRREAVLFSISDRPAQEALGLWREGN